MKRGHARSLESWAARARVRAYWSEYHEHFRHGADREHIHGDAHLHRRTCKQALTCSMSGATGATGATPDRGGRTDGRTDAGATTCGASARCAERPPLAATGDSGGAARAPRLSSILRYS
ncbi:unnamed protein product [Arctia plantaginis]|uniref:Uncharacterized protein n=1 Tax=Arctia plantaginis TaxID=874455 RepID=A0A8S1A813_ARCPL|nr:unnamed protein product [Arctia plantaginis]